MKLLVKILVRLICFILVNKHVKLDNYLVWWLVGAAPYEVRHGETITSNHNVDATFVTFHPISA